MSNILENIDEGIFVEDKNGTLIFVNSTFAGQLNRSKNEILMNTYDAYRKGLIDIHIFDEVLKSKKSVTRFQVFASKNGRGSESYLVTQTPVFDQNSELKYSVGIVRDLNYLARKAEEAKNKKVSHFEIPGSNKKVSGFVYDSDVMKKLVKKADLVADSGASVLIQGESGTGKEVLAEYIHKTSSRSEKELVTVNCAALPENLLEAELFGYEKGAFTGASKDGKCGLVELADQGTLFLDEIDSMPISLQGKLLRVLETHEVRRIGSVKSRRVNFRLLAATNADLKKGIEEKKFRLDLYYRINVVSLTIPPLRERKSDIYLLCDMFLKRYEKKYNRKKVFSEKAYDTILAYDWPGNVRELKNFVERIVLITDVATVKIDNISNELLSDNGEYLERIFQKKNPSRAQDNSFKASYNQAYTLKEAVHEYEQWLIEEAIKSHGSYSKAAKALGVDKSTLVRKRQK